MMKVVGEEGTPTSDFVVYLKSEFLDGVFLQQNTFDKTDGASSAERQRHVFAKVVQLLDTTFTFADKAAARASFHKLRQHFVDWNYAPWDSDEFRRGEEAIDRLVAATAATV